MVREIGTTGNLPAYVIRRTGVVARYTGTIELDGGEEQPIYLVRFLRMEEREESEYSITEAALERVAWRFAPRDVPGFSNEILRHQALHGSLLEKAPRKSGPTDVNHRLVLIACAALVNGNPYMRVGNSLASPVEWLRRSDPDWWEFERGLTPATSPFR